MKCEVTTACNERGPENRLLSGTPAKPALPHHMCRATCSLLLLPPNAGMQHQHAILAQHRGALGCIQTSCVWFIWLCTATTKCSLTASQQGLAQQVVAALHLRRAAARPSQAEQCVVGAAGRPTAHQLVWQLQPP